MTASAACASPTGTAGQFQYLSPDFKFCDGSTWQSMTVSNTGATCSTAGVLTKSGTDLRFCNATNWISVNGAADTSCTGTVAGTMTWKSATSRMEWCDGTNWKIMGVPVSGDPCNGKTIGQVCTGTTALWAGASSGGNYMVMPSGCANSTTNPTCSGIDTVQKTWNNGANYDILGVTNVYFDGDPSPQRGDVITPIIAAVTAAGQGGPHQAAAYCNDMVFGGFSDWSLPSKAELAYLYCKSASPGHNTNNPSENMNCGGTPPTGQLTGFEGNYYWSSTEYSGNQSWSESFYSGTQASTRLKNVLSYIRCIRRY